MLVADVNASASTIADLNQAIERATQSGLPANDLADQRDLLVMKLADQVGATVRHADNGVVDVLVGGMTLVVGFHGGLPGDRRHLRAWTASTPTRRGS